MKKALSLILALVLAVSLLAVPASAASVVVSPQNLSVDGATVNCEKYNIDGNNYFKLRDLAAVLNGTDSQFDVGWDAEKNLISVTTHHAYTSPDGTELKIRGDLSSTAVPSNQTLMIDGVVRTDLTVWNIGGSNFFKLRELGEALGFAVNYNADTQTALVESYGDTAFGHLKAEAVNNGTVTPGGNYYYNYYTYESEETASVYEFAATYAPSLDCILLDVDNGLEGTYVYTALVIPSSLATPYAVVVQDNVNGTVQEGAGTLDPASVPLLDGQNTVTVTLQQYDGNSADLPDLQSIMGAHLVIILNSAYGFLLQPNGYNLSDLGFINSGL